MKFLKNTDSQRLEFIDDRLRRVEAKVDILINYTNCISELVKKLNKEVNPNDER